MMTDSLANEFDQVISFR